MNGETTTANHHHKHEHVHVEIRENGIGVISLDRPKSLNALSEGMVKAMHAALKNFACDSKVRCIVIRSATDRAFCAGGDIKELSAAVSRKHHPTTTIHPHEYLVNEYTLNYRNGMFPKTTITIINGVCMGGGVGISVYCRYKIVTENTVWAMPETGIGFIPDVGSSFFLGRLGAVGLYIGLLGIRLSGADLLKLKLASHYVKAESVKALESDLMSIPMESEHEVEACLARHATRHPPESSLEKDRPLIESTFSCDSIEGIIQRLKSLQNEWSGETLSLLLSRSPTALKVTLACYLKGREATTPKECMEREYVAAVHLLKQPDYVEGVRAAVIDKDRNPRWNPPHPSEVDDVFVTACIEPSRETDFPSFELGW